MKEKSPFIITTDYIPGNTKLCVRSVGVKFEDATKDYIRIPQ